MRSRLIVAALVVLLGASSASAQVLSLEFHDGRVRLTAENVPVSRILDEWARLGGTKIVNGERVPGAPVTLQLTDVPERQALDIVLRGAAGYMVLARDTVTPGASAFDKVLVLPTTSRAPVAAAPPQPAPPPPQFQNRPDTDVDLDEPAENPQGAPPQGPPPGAFPRGRVPNNVPPNAPPNAPPPASTEDEEPVPNDGPAPAPGNPFAVVPGGTRPGTINTPPPRNAPGAEQTPR
jgi:hypothetical protein